MSDYTYKLDTHAIYFEKRNYEFKSDVLDKKKNLKETEKMEEIVKEGIKKDQSIMTRTKNAFFKINRLLVNKDNIKNEPNIV